MTPNYIRTLLHWQTVKICISSPPPARRFRVPALVQQASDYLAVKDLTDSMANAVHILHGRPAQHGAEGGNAALRTRKGCTGIARLPCADAQPPRMQHASKQNERISDIHEPLCFYVLTGRRLKRPSACWKKKTATTRISSTA